MESPFQQNATTLLNESAQGSEVSKSQLVPLVYDELRKVAAQYLRRERRGHTLQPTALVHEAYLRLVSPAHVEWNGKTHFRALAARKMRQILVEHARKRRLRRVPLEGLPFSSGEGDIRGEAAHQEDPPPCGPIHASDLAREVWFGWSLLKP